MTETMRTYVCPQCGYDGFKASPLRFSGISDANARWGCPQCQTLYGTTVWLIETSDPRDEEIAA